MKGISNQHGMSTLVNHFVIMKSPSPVSCDARLPGFSVQLPGSCHRSGYLRWFNGRLHLFTHRQSQSGSFCQQVALLEALDLLSERGEQQLDDIATGKVFASGMSVISSAILARVKAGDVIVAQESLYSNAYNFLNRIAPRVGIEVVWVKDILADLKQGLAIRFSTYWAGLWEMVSLLYHTSAGLPWSIIILPCGT